MVTETSVLVPAKHLFTVCVQAWGTTKVSWLDFWAALPCVDNHSSFTASLCMSGAFYCHEVWLMEEAAHPSRTLGHVSFCSDDTISQKTGWNTMTIWGIFDLRK